ncbi:MAG: hypothetical protein ACT452_05025 [Microthrixaceae bacterium]
MDVLGAGLFAVAIAAVMVAVGVLVHRDLTARGVDPVTTLIWLYFLWPVGLYLWLKKRGQHPHPTLR